MGWKLTYDAPRGLRMNRGFWGVTVPGHNWWCDDIKKWGDPVDFPKGSGYSSHDHSPKTTRAFLRYLKNHPELKGKTVIFVHRGAYESTSLDIEAVWEE